MGLFDKVKNILFDEEEVEIPVIKKEEEKDPIKEIKVPKETFSDKEYKSESTFNFPIDFEDDEPLIEEKPAPKVENPKPRIQEYKPIKKQEVKEYKDYSDFLNRKDDKKKFKPTPIISPVYGVLDQNYKKDDVIVKKEILRKPSELTLDEVRKRAFGTLEDEIDANLSNEVDVIKTKEEVKIKKEQIIEKKKEEVEKPVDRLKTIGELIEDDSYDIDLSELDSIKVEENDDNIIEDVPNKSIDDLLGKEEDIVDNTDEIDEEEEDLFSLIDSMYEEKGE